MEHILRDCLLFENISLNDIKKMFQKITYSMRNYKKDQVIYSEYDFQAEIGILLEGEVIIKKNHSSGREIILNTLQQGEVFGVTTLFRKETVYQSLIEASKRTSILFLKQEALLELFDLNSTVLINYLTYLNNRICFLNRRIESFTHETIEDKVMDYLESEVKKQNSEILDLHLSKSKIADYLCISRASLYRVLKTLEERDIISIKNNRIHFHTK